MDDKNKLISSTFIHRHLLSDACIRQIIDQKEIIKELQSLFDLNVIDSNDMYIFLKKNAFLFPSNLENYVVWWMIEQAKDLIEEEDIDRIIWTELNNTHSNEIIKTFRNLIENMPIGNFVHRFSIDQLFDLYNEDRMIEWCDNTSIEKNIDAFEKDIKKIDECKWGIFIRDYVQKRIHEINKIDDISQIATIISLIGPNDYIDDLIKSEILNRKYNVLNFIVNVIINGSMYHCTIGHNYIKNIYEEITGETIVVGEDKYTMYMVVCDQIFGNYFDGNIMVHNIFDASMNIMRVARHRSDEVNILVNRLHILKKSYSNMCETYFDDAQLFEEETDKFVLLTEDIKAFMQKIMFN